MRGKINYFNHDSGQGTIITEEGTQYFFSYMDCFTPPNELYATDDVVEFELRYVGDMPIACHIDTCEYSGGYN